MFDAVTRYGIGGLAVVVAVLWARIFGLGNPVLTIRLAAGALMAFTVSAVAATSGWLQRVDSMPQPSAFILPFVAATALLLGLSRFGSRAAESISVRTLVGFQVFRLPLELVMHRAATLGIMPEELSYSGYNFDIVTGTGAFVIWTAMSLGRTVPLRVLWLWNVWGCWCLLVIAAIALATSPMLRLFGDGSHVNSWVLYVPYIWLPAILVTAAMFGHVVLTRALLRGRAA